MLNVSKAESIIRGFLEGKTAKELSDSGLGSLKTIYKWRKVAEILKEKQEIEIKLYSVLLNAVLAKRGFNDGEESLLSSVHKEDDGSI